jgi:hypothetical protein
MRQEITVNPAISIPLLPILIILKLTGLINISWWWVIGIPILIPVAALTIIFLALMIASFFANK